MAHMSASGPVLVAVAAALNVAGYTGAVSGATVLVTNDPEQAASLPFTAIAIQSEQRIDTMGWPGKSVLVELHHFSAYRGDRELVLMRNKAIELLHYAALTVTGHVLIAVQFVEGFDLGIEEVAGVKRRHYLDTFSVDVRQSTAA